MRHLVTALVAAGLALSTVEPAHAQYNAATGAGVAGGIAAISANDAAVRTLPVWVEGRELPDWVDPKVGTTSRMAVGCNGVSTELILSGTSTKNFLNATIVNETGAAIELDPAASSVRFQNGLTRRLLGAVAPIDPDWWVQRTLGFPAKEEFKEQEALTIDLVFHTIGGDCSVQTYFSRPKGVPAETSTYLDYSALEGEINLGLRFWNTGGVKQLDPDPGLAMELAFAFYPSIHHGITLAISGDFYGRSGAKRILPAASLKNPWVTEAGLFFGYSLRWFLLDWLSISYNPAIGPTAFDIDSDSGNTSSLETTLISFRQKLRLSARFAKLSDGTELYLAPSLLHAFVPYGKLGEVELRGNSLATMLSLVIGG